MGKTAKIVLALGTIFVICVLLVQITRRFDAQDAPPAFLSEEHDEFQKESTGGRVVSQPTIVQAKPEIADGAVGSPASPRYSETPDHLHSGGGSPGSDTLLPPGLVTPMPELPERSYEPAPDINGFVPRLDTVLPWSDEDVLEINSDANLVDRFDLPINGEQRIGPGAEAPRSAGATNRILTQPEDSFWKISQRVYGTPVYFKALYVHNRARIAGADRVEAGVEILAPELSELRQLYPALCPAESPAPASGQK